MADRLQLEDASVLLVEDSGALLLESSVPTSLVDLPQIDAVAAIYAPSASFPAGPAQGLTLPFIDALKV